MRKQNRYLFCVQVDELLCLICHKVFEDRRGSKAIYWDTFSLEYFLNLIVPMIKQDGSVIWCARCYLIDLNSAEMSSLIALLFYTDINRSHSEDIPYILYVLHVNTESKRFSLDPNIPYCSWKKFLSCLCPVVLLKCFFLLFTLLVVRYES